MKNWKNTDSDPNQNYEILSSALTEAKANHIPKKTQPLNKYKHRKEKWMTSELLKLVVRKNKLYREWKSTTDDNEYQIMQTNFKTYERIMKNKIGETKQKYYFDKFTHFTAEKNDMKKAWATIDETLNRKRRSTEYPVEFFYNNRTTRDLKDIANSFNEYFSSIGPSLSENIDVSGLDKSYDEYLTSSVDTQFSFTPISENETLKIIKNLKNKNSYGVDGISNVLLKSISNEVVKLLTLVNIQLLETGIFPNAFKTSTVIPIYKKGDKANISNYRLISILPNISKIFERVIHIQLFDYFCQKNYYVNNSTGSVLNILRN